MNQNQVVSRHILTFVLTLLLSMACDSETRSHTSISQSVDGMAVSSDTGGYQAAGGLATESHSSPGPNEQGGDAGEEGHGPSIPEAPPYVPDHPSPNYATMDHWMCHPDKTDGPCRGELDVTQVNADGSTEIIPFEASADPQFDCFYVYPTISFDPSKNSDLEMEEEAFAGLMHAARLTRFCRVYAPLYRQVTMTNILINPTEEHEEVAFGDVLNAFDQYMSVHNDGRDMLLIGHSQGARALSRVLLERFGNVPENRARLIAAYLIGASLPAQVGADVGVTHPNIPICSPDVLSGCIVSFASFKADEPPMNDARFGRVDGENEIAICTNPAGLNGGLVPLNGIFPTVIPDAIRGFVAGNVSPFAEPEAHPPITTPFFSVPGSFSGQCVDDGEFHYLAVTINSDINDPRADEFGGNIILPGWGLHLLDINLVSEDIHALMEAQARDFMTQRSP